jgi:uncharacterized protein
MNNQLGGGFMSRVVIFFMFFLIAFNNAEAASDPILLETGSGTIYGTLEIPKGDEPVPVALIISGSGPTDRDGNNILMGKNNSLKLLAEGLALKDIASVRYDKRGIGASAAAGTKEEDLRFDTYIQDAESWGKLLKQDKRFSRLVIIGHSEGALIGTIACKKLGANGFVSIAGSGQPAFELIETQLKKNAPPDLLSESKIILDQLKKGKTIEKISPSLMALFRPSVQPYLISWFAFSPEQELSQISVPSLIVQGTTDIQVSASDADRLLKSNKLAQPFLITGMNHVLKIVPDNMDLQKKSYGDPNLPVPQELIDKIADFVKGFKDGK